MSGLEDKLAAQTTVSWARLHSEWLQLHEKLAPELTTDLQRRGIAHRLQEKAHGGPSVATLREIGRMRRHLAATGEVMTLPVTRTKPGARLVRDWGGASHHVLVLDKGFLYCNQQYRSPSTIASEITGAKWFGPRSFGLRGAANA